MYIENLDITNLRENDQNFCYIEVIVNVFFRNTGDFCGGNIIDHYSANVYDIQ